MVFGLYHKTKSGTGWGPLRIAEATTCWETNSGIEISQLYAPEFIAL